MSQRYPVKLISIADKLGQTLLVVFVVTFAFSAFPLKIGSPEWGMRVSRIVIDACSLAIVGVGLMFLSSYFAGLQLASQHEAIDENDENYVSEDSVLAQARRVGMLAQAGFVSLMLLAIWQIFLFFGAFDQIDQQAFASSDQLNKRLESTEQFIKQAPQEAIDQAWQQSNRLTTSPGIASAQSPQNKRQQLLGRVTSEQNVFNERNKQQINQAKWNVSRDLLRILLLALIYAWAFRGIARF